MCTVIEKIRKGRATHDGKIFSKKRTEMEYTIPFPTNIPNPNLVIIGTPESGKSLTLCELKEILRRRNTLKS